MIAIVDTGGANLASIQIALKRLHAQSEVTSDPRTICKADRVILPGVGAAGDSMDRLRSLGNDEAIKSLQRPVLGICLGMQLLFEASEEDRAVCLGIVPGSVSRMMPVPSRPVPHMGWNRVSRIKGKTPRLFQDIEDGSHFYFVHSYAAPHGEWSTAFTTYGEEVPASLQKDNFFGVQFHPERSGAVGSKLLKNFLCL